MKAVLINLGCKVNKYELDAISNILQNSGFEISYNHEYADIYIVNTCAVTNESEKKSRQYISKINKLNPNAKIIVMGCASQNNIEQFKKYPSVYSAIGIENKGDILKLIDNRIFDVYESNFDYHSITNPLVNTTRAYLKVQDGCNNFCSYCLIPYLRGRSRSRDILDAVSEAKRLDESCKEIVLVGIDLSSYNFNGNDLGDLIYALKDLKARIRIGSLEVGIVTKEFLEKISKVNNLCPQFHLSMQSGSNSILKKMNRHYTKEEYLNKCELLRKYFPGCNITTDVIVGFCDETEEEFNETIETVKKAQFGNIHIFPYSPRMGTVAYKYKNILNSVRHQRVDQLEVVKAELKEKYILSCKDSTYQMLVEEFVDGFATGYTENYIKVYLKDDTVKENDLINVKIEKLFLDGAIVTKVD